MALRKQKFLSASVWLALVLSSGFSACTSYGNFQAPWNPTAELRILDVQSSVSDRFVGIRQSTETVNNQPVIVYSYVEPVVKLELLPGYPDVNFSRFSSKITLSDGTQLPTKEYPLSKGTSGSGTLSIQFPIMSADHDLQNVVFPGNNAPRVRDGVASLILYGKDTNGNNIQVPLTVPLSFESLVFSDSPLPPTAPTPTPSPSPSVSA